MVVAHVARPNILSNVCNSFSLIIVSVSKYRSYDKVCSIGIVRILKPTQGTVKEILKEVSVKPAFPKVNDA
jgi:hypothetical protein